MGFHILDKIELYHSEACQVLDGIKPYQSKAFQIPDQNISNV
jgi:hypothetical protein